MQAGTETAKSDKDWQKTQYSIVIRYVPSGSYYARLRFKGKLIRKSLKTNLISATKLRLADLEKSMDRAAKAVGMARITHHDLRHLFATLCIESGVDILTVSRWLGHKDGVALAMKVYGHLRDQHSVNMAQKASFTRNQTDEGKAGQRKN